MAAPSPPDRAWQAAGLAALLALLALAIFANALNGVFLFDDIGDITANPSAKAATFLDRLGVMNRPLTKATYALQDACTGHDPRWFHGVNVALHALTTALAFLLLRRAARSALNDTALATGLAVCVTAIWAVHPALTETVTYVSGRSMGLSSLLVVILLLAGSGKPGRINAAIVFITAFLAPLARETALIAPLMLLWWRLTLAGGQVQTARRSLPAFYGAALALALIALIPRHVDLVASSLHIRPPLEALRGNIHAAFDILAYWATPFRITIDPAPPLAWGWETTETLARLAFFLGLAGVALVERRRRPLIAFGIGLALLALAPSNTFLWRADPVALKPLYLGGIGLTLAAGSVLILALSSRGGRIGFALMAAMLTAALSLATFQRNTLFADEIALWTDATVKTPGYGRPWIMLGYALFNAGRLDDAAAALRRGSDLDPLDLKAAETLELVESLRGMPPTGR
ncbi:MAG: hypothetical protein QM698_12885 [Micropepsaceae bacterium]